MSLPLPFSVPPVPTVAHHLRPPPISVEAEAPLRSAVRRRKHASTVALIDDALARGQLKSFIAQLSAYIEQNSRSGRTLLPPKSTSSSKRDATSASEVPSPQDLARWTYRIRDLFATGRVERRASARQAEPSTPSSSISALLADCNSADVLASFALAHIFDAHLALGYALEESVAATLLSCLGKTLPSAKDYDEVVRLAFNAYRGGGAGEQSAEVPRAMLSAAIVSYGHLSSPGSGEYLLAKVAHDYHRDATPPAHHANLDLPLNGWASDDVIWCALVRSRCLAGDLTGATRWLDLYRATYRDNTLPQGAKPTKLHDKVYLALMNGVVKADIEAAAPSSASSWWWTDWDEDMAGHRMHVARSSRANDHPLEPSTQHTVRVILATMRDDGVRASTAMLNFLVQFERRCASGGGGGGGSQLAHHASSPRSSALASHRGAELARLVAEGEPPRASQWDSHRFQEAFDGLASSSAETPQQQQQQHASNQRTLRWLLSALAHLHNRAIWKHGTSVGEEQRTSVAQPTRYLRSPTVLRSAFWSALRSSHDIPLALYVLRHYNDWGYAHVLRRNEDGEQQQQPGFIGEQAVRQWLRDEGYEAARLELFASSTAAAKPRLAVRLLLEEALLESRGLGGSSWWATRGSDAAGAEAFRQKRKEVLSATIRQVKLEVRESVKKSKTRRVERRRKEREAIAVEAAGVTAREEEQTVA